MNADQFMTGLLAALASKNYSTLSIRGTRFDAAVERAYDKLESNADRFDVRMRFRVKVDPLHGDSLVVRKSVSTAAQRGIIGLDNPQYVTMRLKIDRAAAIRLLEDLPGGAELFEQVAADFIESYNAGPVAVSAPDASAG